MFAFITPLDRVLGALVLFGGSCLGAFIYGHHTGAAATKAHYESVLSAQAAATASAATAITKEQAAQASDAVAIGAQVQRQKEQYHATIKGILSAIPAKGFGTFSLDPAFSVMWNATNRSGVTAAPAVSGQSPSSTTKGAGDIQPSSAAHAN